MTIPQSPLALLLTLTLIGCASTPDHARALQSEGDPIPMERIMSDPQWMGNFPSRPGWSTDGETFHYRRRGSVEGSYEYVQFQADGAELGVIPEEESWRLNNDRGTRSADGRRLLYSRHGDLFLHDLTTGESRQLTRTSVSESSPRFLLGDASITFRRDGATFVRKLSDGFEWQPAILRDGKDPSAEEEKEKEKELDPLASAEERFFGHITERADSRSASKARRKAAAKAPTRAAEPFYVGGKVTQRGEYLSPDARFLIARLADKGAKSGKSDSMPAFVTDSGYVDNRTVRSKVGTGEPTNEHLSLWNLESRERHDFDFADLSGIKVDPLAFLKQVDEDEEAEDPKARPVRVSVQWSRAGTRAAVEVESADNKDSWLALIDPETGLLTEIDHLHDEAWVNGRFRQFGWLRGERLWFLSEESGYAHLYTYDVASGARKQLTSGDWEVSNVRPNQAGEAFFVRGNREHPGVHELLRIEANSGDVSAITDLGGQNRAYISPDESQVLVLHSSLLEPAELFLQDLAAGAEAVRMTRSASPEFMAQNFVEPEIVAIPSPTSAPIWSRVYTPPADPAGKRPAVMFVHGAGYLQNAHKGWSGYFREFMFHSLLAHRGYVVLDMDYRASAGYGRDWRTAIYRRMGTPELEDLTAGVDWLVANKNVDRERIGVYGGSYGGFMALMALFVQPDLFACGAALRPVTDWAHYNHGYTSNILNTPSVDPEAYKLSSPIEYAEGLEKPLLICHGMLDDNVFFQDSVRLTQRLIELEKTGWEVALFPIEPHGFREPSSWLDEYRRILALFEEHLR